MRLLEILLTHLPKDGNRWTKKERDLWLKAFINALDLCFETDD